MFVFMYTNMLYSKVLFQNIIMLYADYRNPSIATKIPNKIPLSYLDGGVTRAANDTVKICNTDTFNV